MFPRVEDLKTESDVEQKLIWPLLTLTYPTGLAYFPSDIVTKLSTRRLEIGKGSTKKLYYPDYLVVLAGLPILVIEAKAPGESLEEALRDVRLYATEINALFPHSINPCSRAIVCNGERLWASFVDTSSPTVDLASAELSAAHTGFALFIDQYQRDSLQLSADTLRRQLRRQLYKRPITMLGGDSFQAEELPQNTFGATIAGDYGHIFNPKTRADRALIAREAYIRSHRRQRYIEPIDRLIRNAVAPSAAKIPPLEDSGHPKEITAVLKDRKKLENQILLLVGSVGAGKSTFVDYLSLVALPAPLRERTIWLRLNLNFAPLAIDHAYAWTARAILEEFRSNFPTTNFDELSNLEKIFQRELSALRMGPLAVLDPASSEYRVRVADRLKELHSDPLAMSKGLASLYCTGAGRLLVIVLDNCDKRSRDEQLTMFQLAQWAQSEFPCLVVLPLRDVTFDLHHREPPLDTALKQFVFRIEPPAFSEVLQARVRLALAEIASTSSTTDTLSYQLPNGIKVTYPAEDQALYLASILRSLYAHDRFVRQVITGLAGRDVRRALEIFLDFCMSGHIGEDEIYKIRFWEGRHVLPLSVVARVLLRMQRKYYDGNRSYVKNIVQCDPDDSLPDHFVRLLVLHWFQERLKINGPAGVEGFHRAADMLSDLSALGHDSRRVRLELLYLTRESCLVAEHLRTENIADGDLLKITAAGVVHLQLMTNPEYLAACAEDTWIGDELLCARIADRLGKGVRSQFSPITTARNAREFVDYLLATAAEALQAPDAYLSPAKIATLRRLREAKKEIAAAEVTLPDRLFVGGIPPEANEKDVLSALLAGGLQVRRLTIPRDKATGKSRGFAFIEMRKGSDVLAALDRDGEISVLGRRLRINEAHPLEEEHIKQGGTVRPMPPLSTRIFVANLPYSLGATDVRTLLASHDVTVRDVYLMSDKRTGRFRGAGFIEVGTLDEAAQAIGTLDGLEIQGRRLVARPADPREAKG